MNFKPGDKVWVHHQGDEYLSTGTYAAVILGPCRQPSWDHPPCPWYSVDVPDFPPPPGFKGTCSPERSLTPRFDPPPQQEPKQQREPTWDDIERLVQWRPAVTEVV